MCEFNIQFRLRPVPAFGRVRYKSQKKNLRKKKVDAITITTDFAEKYNWGLGTNNVREFTLSEG